MNDDQQRIAGIWVCLVGYSLVIYSAAWVTAAAEAGSPAAIAAIRNLQHAPEYTPAMGVLIGGAIMTTGVIVRVGAISTARQREVDV